MHRLALWIQAVLVPGLGPLGLFVVGFCDSSFLSLPEVSDLLVVTSSAARPDRAWLFVLVTTLGSLAGCIVIWELGRRGGEPLLVRRFGAARVERSRRIFARWGVLALAVPALLPPPLPFKIFVLAAGVFGFSFRRLVATLTVARGLRYGFWALAGVFYGEQGLRLLEQVDRWFVRHHWTVLAGLAALVLSLVLAFLLRRRLRTGVGEAG